MTLDNASVHFFFAFSGESVLQMQCSIPQRLNVEEPLRVSFAHRCMFCFLNVMRSQALSCEAGVSLHGYRTVLKDLCVDLDGFFLVHSMVISGRVNVPLVHKPKVS
jgi:hypothetical protein